MNNGLFIFGLVFLLVLILIPIWLIVRMLVGVIVAYREEHARERKRTVCTVSGLGDFESLSDGFWSSDFTGLHVTIQSAGTPDEQAILRLQAAVKSLPMLAEQASQFLIEHDETARALDGGPSAFTVVGLVCFSDETVDLELSNPQDLDGFYRVGFKGGTPFYAARDD